MYVRLGVAVAAVVAGVVLVLFGLRSNGASLEPLPFQPVTETPQVSIDVNTSPVVWPT